MKSERHKSCITRLRRVEGQVRGIQRMIEEDRYCIDILTQMQAVKAAFKKVEDELLKAHADACVEDAIDSGDPAKQRDKFNELIDLFGKTSR
ncbi:MAG: metal-sensitive transcriptional regulator [Alphaproteobacteria bacterium]